MVMDKEFSAAVAPMIEAFKSLPKLAPYDVEGRRSRLSAIQGPPPVVPDDVVYKVICITSSDGTETSVYHFRRKSKDQLVRPTAAVVHAHGGGLISMTPEISIESLADIVHDTGVQVFSVDYRLAPEHQYPAALDDLWSTLLWIRDNADELGIDQHRIAVMGESAGGGLAAAVAIKARDLQLSPPIALQVLLCPMLDDRTKEEVQGFTLWDAADNLTGWTAYLGNAVGSEEVPVYAVPGRLEDARGLPPLYMDGGQDDLFAKENVDYLRKFLSASIPVEFHLHPGLPHGFDGLVPTHSVSKKLRENRKQVLKKLQEGNEG